MRFRFSAKYLLAIPILCILVVAGYNVPFVHEHLSWRVDNLYARIQYAIHPPEQAVFLPQEQDLVNQIVQATLTAAVPTVIASPTSTLAPTPTHSGITPTPAITGTSTPQPTAIPASVRLRGIVHEYQKWNNCGPANMAMALSFWAWKGDQLDIATVVKPNPRDKNVMPYEMADFVNANTSLRAVVRVGGDLDTLKRLTAAGFPVLIEKGFEGAGFDGWMGHYEVVSGYDDAKSAFWVYDSYVGPDTDFTIPYSEVLFHWQAFNYIYVVIYPPEREQEVISLLGSQWDETSNNQYAAQISSDEIYSMSGRQLYFAWYNRGTNLVRLQDYAGAAAAYDEAFAIYPSIPENKRPWRMLWYQTGPYFAYYYSGRYYDVINLATITLDAATEPALEESYYWRGMANLALGATDSAIADFQSSLQWHPGFEPSTAQLQALGVTP
jgi:Peptidase_C39 like family/Tetratricopeptide repeat